MENDLDLNERDLKLSLFFRVADLDPDPHNFWKLDPDPDPQKSEKLNPDPD
jgi:hypothetical protein